MDPPNLFAKLAGSRRFGSVRKQAMFWLACSLLAVSVLLSGMAVAFAFLNAPEPVLDVAWVAVIIAIPFPAVGVLIVSKQPANAIGWIFCVIGFLQGLNIFAGQYGRYALLARRGSLPGGEEMIWLESWTWIPSMALLTTFLLLLFPNGRLPSPRWRWLAWMAAGSLALAVIFLAAGAWSEGGLRILCAQQGSEAARAALKTLCTPELVQTEEGLLVQVGFVGLAVTGVSALASVTSLIVRFRRSTGVERQQIKWFALASIVALACLAAMFTPLDDYRSVLGLGILAIPIAVGIAVLRYRLYDIDLIINRTLVYVALTAVVVGIYVLVVGYLGAVFQTRGSLAISVLAAGVVAVLFGPLRERLQRGVNRLMYGERDDPYAVLSRLGQRLEGTLAPDAALETVVETVVDALKLPYAAIALEREDGFRTRAERGSQTGQTTVMPLIHAGEPVGRLILAPRPGEGSFSPADRRLLEDLSRQAGAAAHAARLAADLQRSREKLVTAREEERRRIRRDLHDGLGPRLAAQSLKAGSARALYARDPAAADALLSDLEGDAQTAIAEIRRLVHDLRPPALDELGLVGALREVSARYSTDGLAVSVEASEPFLTLPAAVEVAAYRIVSEALTNVARHANAKNCTVRLKARDSLGLEVLDDGGGLREDREAGVGLRSMRERAEELGGEFTVEAMSEGGTRVLAELPLPAAEKAAEARDPEAEA